MKHGVGKLLFADGSFYEGEFYRNLMHGTGSFRSTNDSYKYQG